MARQLEWQKLASPGSGAWESESKAPSGLVPGEPHVLACRRPLCHRLHGVAGERSRESPQEGARPGRPGPGPHVPIRLTHLCKGLAPVTRGGSGPPRGVGGDTIRRTTVVNMERSLCCEFLMTFHCEHNKTDRSGDGVMVGGGGSRADGGSVVGTGSLGRERALAGAPRAAGHCG